MIKINIKQQLATLSGTYETKVFPFFDKERLTHKHVTIPRLGKTFVRDNDLNWYEGECTFCHPNLYKRFLNLFK